MVDLEGKNSFNHRWTRMNTDGHGWIFWEFRELRQDATATDCCKMQQPLPDRSPLRESYREVDCGIEGSAVEEVGGEVAGAPWGVQCTF